MMTKRQMIEQLLEQYRQQRQAVLHEADKKRAVIAQKAPIYQDLEQRILQLMRQARQHPERARDAVYTLQQEAQRQLAAAGYTPEDLQPQYRCNLCKDTGYVGETIKTFCPCFEKQLHQMQIQQEDLKIPSDHNFDCYDLNVFPEENGQRNQMARAKKWALDFADAVGHGTNKDVVLFGSSGLGKTFLLDCIITSCIQNGCSAMKLSAFALNDLMRKKHMGQEEERFELAQRVDVLGIDDLGTEPMLENVTVEYLFALICQRQEWGKSTLITTNLSLQEFRKRYSERIATRLHQKGNYVIELHGKDVRMS